MSKFTGNIIRLPAVTPTQNSASGVYTLDDQFTAQSSGTWPIVRDQYFNYTTLLLTGAVQGTAYPNPVTQPYSFLSDASTNNFVVSPNGDVSARPFNPYLNNYSNRFDGGTSTRLTLASSSDFAFGTGAYTIEAWVYIAAFSSSGNIVFDAGNASGSIALSMSNTGGVLINKGGTGAVLSTSSSLVSLNAWNHIAASRVSTSSNETRIFVNGVLSAIGTDNNNWTVTTDPSIGGLNVANYTINGYISNLSVLKGTAKYTSSFTPSTNPLPTNTTNQVLLACQANRFIDSNTATTAKTITVNGSPAVSQNSPFVSYDTTNGSGYFDGTGDYLNAGSSSSLACGSGSFTVETWIYPSVLAQSSIYASTANGGQFFSFASGQGIGVGRVNVAWDYSTNVFPVYYAWNHIVWVRSGSNLSIYLNGTRIGNTTNSQNYTLNGGSATIGTEGSIASTIPGCYISNFRVAPGTAIYDPTLTTLTNTLTGATGVPTAPLPVVSGTSLLTLQTRAPATNNGFIDSSPNNFVVTRNGNTTQGSFSPFSPTGWSYYLADQQNNTVNFTTSAGTDFQFSGDFTIEGWVYAQNSSGDGSLFVVSDNTNYLALNISISANVFNIYLNGGTPAAVITSDIPVAAWTHVAMVRNGSGTGNIKLYVNGGLKGSATNTSTLGFANPAVARIGGGVSGINRYYSNVRVCKSAVYTAAFTPSTLPLSTTSQGATNCVLLTANANRFLNQTAGATATITGSPSVQAFSPFAPAQSYIPSQIGGSGYFDGTGSGTAADYLTVPDSPVFTLGSGDFTLETWIYSTLGSGAERYYIAHTDNATAAASQFALYQRSADAFILFEYYVSTTANSITSGAAITLNQWNHIAVCRSNGTLSMFVNGVRPATGTTNISTTAFNDSASSLGIGGRTSGAALLTGNISGMRLVRGTDIYGASNTTITVPTAPPTAIPNTSLLLNFTNGGIVDATGKNIIETLGNATQSTAQSKWSNSGSFLNNGAAGSRFQVSSSSAPPLFNVGSGDYTVEFWVNTGTPASQQCILDFRNADVAGQGYALIFNTSRQIIMYYNVGNRITTSAISANVWTHVAVVRYNGVYTIYVDGSASGGTYNNSDAVAPPANRPLIGSVSDGSQVFNGNFSNFRISRIARYTSNFNTNLPSGPFPLG